MIRLLLLLGVAASALALPGCAARESPPVRVPVVAPAVRDKGSVVPTRSVAALQRFYDENPASRSLIGDMKVIRAGVVEVETSPTMRYIKFTQGSKTVYGIWAVGSGIDWTDIYPPHSTPYDYPRSAFDRNRKVYGSKPMSKARKTRFLDQLVRAYGADIGDLGAELDTARRGTAVEVVIKGAQLVTQDVNDYSDWDINWLYDPATDTVLQVWTGDDSY